MKRAMFILFLSIITPLFAGDDARDNISEIVPPKENFRVSNRLLFVIDVSGSMYGEGERAIAAMRCVLEVPADDLQAAAIAFSSSASRWQGMPEPCKHSTKEKHSKHCVLPGWATFPGHNKELYGWLRTFPGDGDTRPDLALRAAYEDKTDLITIIFITDGIFDFDYARQAIQNGQSYRKKNKLSRASLMIWTVGDYSNVTQMKELAKYADGGYWASK